MRLTKLAVRQSLIELLQGQPISKISVTMICQAADINRSTFYAHYADQYDLLKKLRQEAVEGIKTHVFATSFTRQRERAVPAIIEVLEYVRDNKDLFSVLLGANGDTNFQTELMRLVKEKSLDELREDKRLGERTAKYLELFVVAGILSMIRTWLEGGCADEPTFVAGLMTRFLYQGIFKFYTGSQ